MSLLPKNTHYHISSDLTMSSSLSSKLIFSIKLPEEIVKELSSAKAEPLSLIFNTSKMGQLSYGGTKSWSFIVTNEAGPVDLLHRTEDHLVGSGSVQAKISVKNELEASKMLAIRSKSEQAEKDRRERKSIVLPEAVPKSQSVTLKKSVINVPFSAPLKKPILVSTQSAPASTAVSPSTSPSPSSLPTIGLSLTDQSSQSNPGGLSVKRSFSTVSNTVTSDTKPRNPVSLIHLPEAAKQKLKRLMGKRKKTQGPAPANTVHRDRSSQVKSMPTVSPMMGHVPSPSSLPVPAFAALPTAKSRASAIESVSGSTLNTTSFPISSENVGPSDSLSARFKLLYGEYKDSYTLLTHNQAYFNGLATSLQKAHSAEALHAIQQTIETAYAERGESHMATEQKYRKLHFELLALKEQMLKEKDQSNS